MNEKKKEINELDLVRKINKKNKKEIEKKSLKEDYAKLTDVNYKDGDRN